ncbi:competence CoiA-like predicted nuclease [Ureibacillus xyleni]|uniref:Competence CoiA-like predicted nuclease n=1 Tax=Ureibacillus xyleni TaxID=614648 RepID=A0A285RCS5_9BACL|nr:competence protein CoiA family protein [Ureibacillus xyleni]SOB91694.1 competence CoiA-like predicted nuclease [Ureibacillus xyleni]
MLVAYTDQNQRFVLHSSILPSTLKQLRTTTNFYCPQCKQQLQLKVGHVKIPHFAHVKKSECEHSFSDGESPQHLEGKEQLFLLFQTLRLNVQLEPYLPKLKQRPDLLLHHNNKQFAIEFQCSPIPNEKLTQRNSGYSSASIIPIWIPATPSEISEGINKISINKQIQQFIISTKHQQYIMMYNPFLRQFIYLSNILFVHGNTFIAKVNALPIQFQNFPFYLPKNLTREEFERYLIIYNKAKHNYLKSRVLISRTGVKDLLLRSIYELRLNLLSLPCYIGVPLKGSEVLNLFSVEWQVALFYFLKVYQISVGTINKSVISHFLKWSNINGTEETYRVVMDYCDLLKALSIHDVNENISKEHVDNYLYSQFLAIKSQS